MKKAVLLSFVILSAPAWGQGEYPLPFAEGDTLEAPQLTKLVVSGSRSRTYTPKDALRYHDFTREMSAPVGLGRTLSVTPYGTTLPATLAIDLNDDGQFTADEQVTLPFTADATLTPGIRRARLTVGDTVEVCDFLVDIHAPATTLDVDGQHARFISLQRITPEGDTVTSRGLTEQVCAYRDLKLSVQPVMPSGYTCDSVYVTYGYNLDGPQLRHGNLQWRTYRTTAKASKQYEVNISANYTTANLRIRADYRPKATCPSHITFADEFNEADGTLADNTRWRTSDRQGAAWNRFISADPRVAHIEGGRMAMRCMKDGDSYISGAKDTRGRFSFTNGYVEARILTTPHTGNFPAFWLMPDDQTGGWPTCGEIDIWETINNEDRAYQTVHSNWTYNLGRTGNPQSGHNQWCRQAGEYHYYGLRKEPTRLTWYVDGIQACTYDLLDTDDARANNQWPYDKRFYIIINQSVGTGSWAAAPDPAFTYLTLFDWVRVYQTPEQLAQDENPDVINNVKCKPLNEVVYDLTGRRVTHPRHGLYIIGGRKVAM